MAAVNGYEKLIMLMRNQAKNTASSSGVIVVGEVTSAGKVKIGDLVMDADDVETISGVIITASTTILCTIIGDDVYVLGTVDE